MRPARLSAAPWRASSFYVSPFFGPDEKKWFTLGVIVRSRDMADNTPFQCNPCHAGYLAGLKGEGPNPDPRVNYPGSEYELGYLHGCEDREAGVAVPTYFGYADPADLPIRPGMTVLIPKGVPVRSTGSEGMKLSGTSRRIRVHHLNRGSHAYRTYHGEFVRPVNPSVVWSGSGSYWHEADINAVTVVSST